jgi:hypothetical protein
MNFGRGNTVKLKQLILMSASVIALGSGGLVHAATTYNWTWSTTLSGNPAPDNTSWTPATTTGDWCSGMTSTSMSTYGNCARWGGSETPASPQTNVLQVTAFSNTGTLPSGAAANDYRIENAYLAFWGDSGVGVVNRNTGGADAGESNSTNPVPSATVPEHAIDNQGRYDMILLTFDRAVSLTGVDIGWSSTDSDITVLAFNSAATPDSLVGQSYGNLQAGWQLVGHYADADTVAVQGISTSITSRYWLVGAYNALISPNGISAGNDYVKIRGFTASETQNGKVPEPSSAMLVAAVLGAGGWVARRRRPEQKAA